MHGLIAPPSRQMVRSGYGRTGAYSPHLNVPPSGLPDEIDRGRSPGFRTRTTAAAEPLKPDCNGWEIGKTGWSATSATTGALEGVGEHVRVEVLTQPDYGGEIAEELPQTEISFPAGSAFAEKTLRITNRPPDLMSRRHPLAST